jgi:hypothetical protein
MMLRGASRQGRIAACAIAVTAGATALCDVAAAGPAVGQFEVKTLESEPGEIEFQSQNAYAFGNPRRKIIDNGGGDIEADDNSLAKARNALELEFGITPNLKTRIGIEYEKERREEFTTAREAQGYEDLKLDEYAAEVIWIAIPRKGDGAGFGVVVEYEVPAESGGARTLIAGPIFEWANGPWLLSLNPTLVQFFGGERNDAGQKDEKIDFAYANQLKYRWSNHIDLALESYGTVDRVGGRGGKSEEAALFGDFDQHRLGPVIYWNFTPSFAAAPKKAGDDDDDEKMVSLGVGALFGLNDNTPDTTLKLSMEVIF